MYTDSNGDVNVLKLATHITIGLILIVLIFGSFGVIGAGERGIKTRLGAVIGQVDQGFYFKLPLIEKVTKMNVRTQAVIYERENPLAGASKDLQDVQVATVVNYHLDPNKVVDIYVQYGSEDNFEEQVIRPAVRAVVKAVTSQYTAEELVTKRADFSSNVLIKLNESLVDNYVIVEQGNITNLQFSPAFTQAIEAKVTAVQNAEAAKNKLEQVKYEKEQRIEQAQGEAEAIRIQAQAITQQGGADYVKLKWIEKWTGLVPQTILGEQGVIIDINK